jgi:hypothetical protein
MVSLQIQNSVDSRLRNIHIGVKIGIFKPLSSNFPKLQGNSELFLREILTNNLQASSEL